MSSPSSAQPIQQPSSTDDSIASPALNAEEGVAPAPPPVPSVEGGVAPAPPPVPSAEGGVAPTPPPVPSVEGPEGGVAPAPPPADGVNHPSDDSDSESGDDDLEPAPAREWRRAKTLKDIGLHVCSPSKYKLIIII